MVSLLALPQAWVAVGIVAGTAFTGFFSFIGVFKKEKKANTKEAEDALTFVNTAFRQKIEALEKQVKEQAGQIDDQDKRLVAIEKENILLREILQGRDAQAQEFQTKGLNTINVVVPEILNMTKATNQSVNKMAKSIDNLVQALNVQTTTTTTVTPVKTDA